MLKNKKNQKRKNCLSLENCLNQKKSHQKVGINLILELKRLEQVF